MPVDDDAEIHDVDPNDSFWDAETYAGDAMSAGEIDDVVYGTASE
jgi:hypothetical protein